MLDVRGLHAGYATAGVLRGVDLSVGEGLAVALLGRNGMGKTTLLRAICGLAPPSVSAGSIMFAGHEVLGLAPHRIARRGIGLVPQGRRVFRSLSVEENLAIVARPGAGGAWTLLRVFELFPRLAERRRQAAASLSGGEQQMLAIGRALMTNPLLLVMDEPSEGLAPTVLEVIRDRLLLLKQTGQSVLLAEQNVDLGMEVADRVDILGDAGTVAWSGQPDRLRTESGILRDLIGI